MKLPGIAKTLLFFLFCSFPPRIFSQLSTDDSTFYHKAVKNAVALYYHSLGDQSGLYNGSLYTGYSFTFKEGHPFFYTDTFSRGSIVYDNVLYQDVRLLFDEVAEIVILQDASHRIQLLNDKISRFAILDNNFTHIVNDSLNLSAVNQGFFHLLYEGNVSVLKKEAKTIREIMRSITEGLLRYIDINKHYYIKKDHKYYPVKGKRDVLDIYINRRKEIQQYIKSNYLSFHKDRDTMLIKISAYYDQLTK